MVHGSSKLPTSADSLQATLTSLRHQIAVSANMITTTLAVFGIGYFLGHKMTGDKSYSLFCGLVAAMVIMIVEMTLYIIRACKQDEMHGNIIEEAKKRTDEFRIITE